jgi:predicted PurR-regulated permease PerM
VTALFNYIPYLGSLLTAVLLGITALLTFDGLAEPALVLAAFLGLTIFEGQIVTPLVLGRQLALNPLIVFLSVLFWFWLWGIAGALMAVPILITLKLIGDRVDWLRPLAVIAGR